MAGNSHLARPARPATAQTTRTKQLIAAVGALVVLIATTVLTGEFDTEEIVLTVVELLTVLGVGEVPNRPK